MKITIGGKLMPGREVDTRAYEREITKMISDKITDRAIDVTPRLLRGLRDRIQAAAMSEANKIFENLIATTDRPRQQLSSMNLTGFDVARGGPRDMPTPRGFIRWPELSLKYGLHKGRRKRKPENRNRMFRYNDVMRNYFKRSGQSIVRSRLGGIQVSVDDKVAKTSEARGTGSYVEASKVGNLVLGRVTVTMFPRLSPALAPMLSSRRWTDHGNGAMERVMFGGTRTLDKLLNKGQAFRPLVAPTVQFFMLVRIPAVVRRNVADYFKRTGEI